MRRVFAPSYADQEVATAEVRGLLSALARAAAGGDADAVRAALEAGASVNEPGGVSALMLASRGEHVTL